MPEFEVSYLSSTYEFFYVTADTKEEAESLVWEGNLLPDATENNSWVHSWTILRGEDSLIRAIPPYDEEPPECPDNCSDWNMPTMECSCKCH
jgi:hypothetical protein